MKGHIRKCFLSTAFICLTVYVFLCLHVASLKGKVAGWRVRHQGTCICICISAYAYASVSAFWDCIGWAKKKPTDITALMIISVVIFVGFLDGSVTITTESSTDGSTTCLVLISLDTCDYI